MSELLWSHVDDRYDQIDKSLTNGESNRGVAKFKYSLWVDQNKVSLCLSYMTLGVPSHNHRDKRYMRWDTVEALGLRRLSTGTITPFYSKREYPRKAPYNWRAVTPFSAIDIIDNDFTHFYVPNNDQDAIAGRYQEAVRNVFGIRTMSDLYPAAAQLGLFRYIAMPFTLRTIYKQPTVEAFSKACFGVSRYSADLERAITRAHPVITSLARDMRGLTDTANIIEFLKLNEYDEDNNYFRYENTPALRKMFLAMKPESVDNLSKVFLDAKQVNSVARLGGHYLSKYPLNPNVSKEVFTMFSEVR